jgi:hypothetical protein
VLRVAKRLLVTHTLQLRVTFNNLYVTLLQRVLLNQHQQLLLNQRHTLRRSSIQLQQCRQRRKLQLMRLKRSMQLRLLMLLQSRLPRSIAKRLHLLPLPLPSQMLRLPQTQTARRQLLQLHLMALRFLPQ